MKVKEEIYDALAEMCGYIDFQHMKRNEQEIDNQVKILFNHICEEKGINAPFQI